MVTHPSFSAGRPGDLIVSLGYELLADAADYGLQYKDLRFFFRATKDGKVRLRFML